MALIEQENEIILDEPTSTIYPSWDAFVKAKLDRANELLSQMDQNALRELINSKSKPAQEEVAS